MPGVTGARSVKWLSRIITSKDESDSHWQQVDSHVSDMLICYNKHVVNQLGPFCMLPSVVFELWNIQQLHAKHITASASVFVVQGSACFCELCLDDGMLCYCHAICFKT